MQRKQALFLSRFLPLWLVEDTIFSGEFAEFTHHTFNR